MTQNFENDREITAYRLDDLVYPNINLNDHTLDGNLSLHKSPPESECLRLPPRTNVGVLDALPLEILQDILSQLDLCPHTDFRLVNRRAIELVNSLPQYKAINAHALNALHGILSIETGRWITCRTLFEKLCTPGCELCGDFGSYLYLLTCKRVCFLCFSQDRLYLPLPLKRASRKFGLDSRIMKTLPRMRVIRGTYSPNEKRVCAPSVLVDYESALHAGISLHGSVSAMLKYVADMKTQKLDKYNTRMAAVRRSGSITRRTRQPQTSDPFDGQSGNPFRFVAIVRVPWLNRSSQEVTWGFHCVGCKKSCRPPLHYRRKFTAFSFDDHLKQFETESEGLVLVDNKFLKYIPIDAGLYGRDDMCFGPSLISLLPPLPSRDWKQGCISRDLKTGEAHFSTVSKTPLSRITKIWHPIQVDHLKLREEQKLRSGVYEVTCPGFSSTIVAKFTQFEWEVPQLEAETTAYEWIEGQLVGPAFLGHLIEEGRVIHWVPHGPHRRLSSRDAGGLPSVPLDLVKTASDGKATLIDFDNASRPASDDELEAERHKLQTQLRDTSGRGGKVAESSPD
ncbi:MAG: hypothetical protein Q9160_000380 [Pyrenula sp. 1 TL-2023]